VDEMQESQINKKKRLKLARKLFLELLNKKDTYPKNVANELSADLQLCEDKLSDTKPILKDLQDKKYEVEHIYDIYTPNGKSSATQKQNDDWKANKTLFVDGDNNFVYIDGVQTPVLSKRKVLYNTLICLLKKRGSTMTEKIYDELYELYSGKIWMKKIKEPNLKDKENYVGTQMDRLNKIFFNKAQFENRDGQWHLDKYYTKDEFYKEREKLDFVLAERKMSI
jgi:hypothetical protein